MKQDGKGRVRGPEKQRLLQQTFQETEKRKLNLVWIELPVKSLALGVLYTALAVFVEMFILKVFGNNTVHIFNPHNGYIAAGVMSVFFGMGVFTGTGAYFWDKFNPPTQYTSDHIRHHRQKNPFRQLYNIFPWLFITISHRFNVLKTHEEHQEETDTPGGITDTPPTVPDLGAFAVDMSGRLSGAGYGAISRTTMTITPEDTRGSAELSYPERATRLEEIQEKQQRDRMTLD